MYQIKIMLPKRNVEFHINLNNGYATCKSQTLLHTHIHSQHTRRIEIPDQGKKFILLNYRRKKRKKKNFHRHEHLLLSTIWFPFQVQ